MEYKIWDEVKLTKSVDFEIVKPLFVISGVLYAISLLTLLSEWCFYLLFLQKNQKRINKREYCKERKYAFVTSSLLVSYKQTV